MDDRLIHPMYPKSTRSTQGLPSTTAIAIMLATLLVLAMLLTSAGRVGVDASDQPLRPPSGFGL